MRRQLRSISEPRRMRGARRRLGPVRLVLCLSVFGLLACASGPPRPAWIDQRPPAFSDERWVVGVGSGSTPEQSADRAIEAIGKLTGGEAAGASIAERWADADEKRYWTLAVMDRVPLRTRLAGELAAILGDLPDALEEASSEEAEQALDGALRSLRLLAERDSLKTRIVALGGPAADPGVDPDRERRRLEDRLSKIKRDLIIEIASFEMDPQTGEIRTPLDKPRTALAATVTGLGFRVAGAKGWDWKDSPAWLSIELRLGRERLDLTARDPFVAVHWDAALEITDAENKLIAVLTDEGRSTHVREAEARRRAWEEAEQFATAALEEWLSGRLHPAPTAH